MTKARTLADFDASGVLTSTSTLNPTNLDSTGTIPAALLADVGGGKVLQVVHGEEATAQTINSSSWTALTDVTASITPSATDSKILIFVNTNAHINHDTGWWVSVDRFRTSDTSNTTVYAETAKSTYINFYGGSGGKVFVTSPVTSQDTSHNTTSSCTYSVKIKTDGEVFFNNQRPSSITVMEIAA